MKHKKSLFKRCSDGEVSPLMQYIYNNGVMLSQVLSTILGGDPDETVSGRTGKAARAGKKWFVYVQEPFINWLFRDKRHCEDAIEDDEGKKQLWDWAS